MLRDVGDAFVFGKETRPGLGRALFCPSATLLMRRAVYERRAAIRLRQNA